MSTTEADLSSLSLSSPPPRTAQARTAVLRSYFRLFDSSIPGDIERDARNSNKKFWYCVQAACLWKSSVTTNCYRHLEVAHEITIQPELTAVQQRYEELAATHRLPLVEEDVNIALCELITRHSLPLSIIESLEFHTLLGLLHPGIHKIIIKNRVTFRAYVIAIWNKTQLRIIEALKASQSEIHLSLDIWTSPNNLLFLGVIAHFVRNDQVEQILIGFKRVAGHSGEAQFATLQPLLASYQITTQIGVVMADNSTTNDTLCRAISHWLADAPIPIQWDAEIRRTRCLGHVLNLIAQAFLFSGTSDITEEELEAFDREDQGLVNEEEKEDPKIREKKRRDRFRTFGLLGKLHNIVVHIRSSPDRTRQFESTAERRIPMDNRTRWNSWFNMITVAIKLESSIDYYVKGFPDLEKDIITVNDWLSLYQIAEFLNIFSALTLQNEGHQHNIATTIPSLWPIKIEIEVYQLRLSPEKASKKKPSVADKDLLQRLESCMNSWLKYWNLIWNHPFYLLATLLHPKYRLVYLQNIAKNLRLDKSLILETITPTWDAWKALHQSEERITTTRRKTLNRIQKLKSRDKKTILEFNEDFLGDQLFDNSYNELTTYLQELPDGKLHDGAGVALNWWLQSSAQTKYPLLSKLAITLLSIPAMSAEAERVFSCARRTISWDRSRLAPDLIEALECLKYWYRQEEKRQSAD